MNYGNRLIHLRYLYKRKIGESWVLYSTSNINNHGALVGILMLAVAAVVEFYSEYVRQDCLCLNCVVGYTRRPGQR